MTWWAWAAVGLAAALVAGCAVVVYCIGGDSSRGIAAGPHTPTAGRIRSPWNATDRYL